MTAITTEVDRRSFGQPRYSGTCLVKGSTTIPKGAIVSVVSGTGYAINGATAITHLVQGWATETVANTGADGAASVEFTYGAGLFSNTAATDNVTQADFGKPCFLVDNDTVAKGSGGGTRSIAGIVLGLVDAKVAVLVGPHISASLRALLALGGGTLANFQIATGTITNGVCVINTGIVVTANTYVIPVPLAAITGSINVGPLAHIKASDVVGAAGVGAVTINVLSSAGSTDTDAAGTLVAFLVN